MKKSFIITLLAGSSALFADSVLPGAGPWQTVATPITTGAGGIITSQTTTNGGVTKAYWDNISADPSNGQLNPNSYPTTDCWNIGCFVTGTGVFANPANTFGPAAGAPNLSPALPTAAYVGNNDGTAVQDIYFAAPGVQNPQTMLAELAGNNDRDWLGWYDQTVMALPGGVANFTTLNRGTAWDIIFSAGQTTGATASFTPTANFGLFFFDAPSGQQTGSPAVNLTSAQIVADLGSVAEFTQSSKNTAAGEANLQHFAVFATSAAAGGVIPANFYVGVEDLPAGTSDRDFNDMVVNLRIVPEPGYFLLLSLGLGGLALARRRLQKTA